MMISDNDLRELVSFHLFLRRLKKVGISGLLKIPKWRKYLGVA